MLALAPVEDRVATAAPAAEVALAATTKAAGPPAQIRAYDKWGCPGATRETRDGLGSPSCCSRTTFYVFYMFVSSEEFLMNLEMCYYRQTLFQLN